MIAALGILLALGAVLTGGLLLWPAALPLAPPVAPAPEHQVLEQPDAVRPQPMPLPVIRFGPPRPDPYADLQDEPDDPAPAASTAAPPVAVQTPAAPLAPPPAPRVETAMLVPPAPPPGRDAAAQPQWLRNAVPVTVPAGHPVIAVIIDDMGVDKKRSGRVIGLPGPLTLAWLPYATDLPRQTRAARTAGHELLVHLPMEPGGDDADPGPNALLTSLGREEIARRLAVGLGAFDGYVGVNNHMGSKFTADRSRMQPVLEELRRRGLLWVDSKTTGASVGPAIAHSLKVPNLSRDVFLDHEMTPAAVRASLARLEQIARSNGAAVAIGHPHDVTIEALEQWLPSLARKGFTLVPVTAIVKARFAGG